MADPSRFGGIHSFENFAGGYMQSKQDQSNDSVRRTYAAPQLNEYGRVRDLTAGGSAGQPELTSSSPNKARP